MHPGWDESRKEPTKKSTKITPGGGRNPRYYDTLKAKKRKTIKKKGVISCV